MKWLQALGLLVVAAFAAAAVNHQPTVRTVTVKAHPRPAAQTMYIRNLAPAYISDSYIRHAIPAWEQAVNHDFAKYWHTTRYRLVFIGRRRAPSGEMNATFVKKGPVKGALAYHFEENGAPSITVYAGTGAYYGYDNSVSFTHELFELAADPVTSYVSQGWPYDYFWLEHKNGEIQEGNQAGTLGWFLESADPVEADSYLIGDVKISDFVTPAWFNDGQNGGTRYDFMGLCHQPFWIRPGGYAQYLGFDGWHAILNFRGAGRDPRGFWIAEGSPRHS